MVVTDMTSTICLIRIRNNISRRTAANLGLATSVGEEAGRVVTTLSGEVLDQAALMGILNNLYDLGYTILAVEYPSSLKETIEN